ncbi:PAS domain S-box-containing protein [Luteibacter sp. UNCMF331Sha3.1]|uniref:hybrid sensor histidine kinase/response regulator n=1 Tax=Luteibacter sp. UNCMF331Sha3.1 TaxID=1502760 RepID=UPI0008C2EA59|nr:PAS-domain containing protein [Luteibacter sp. UNCMF331Sha3.1]SEN32022.1 PAS domain S-box-containing protein [Luteibacter sp. UNCMF331Sha3.1]
MNPWLVTLAAALWLCMLFGVALVGERRPALFERRWSIVYALSLAIHCTSWTFYGTVTQASRSGWWLPPTFVGAILMYVLAVGVLRRLVVMARDYNAGSVADLIAARLGRHRGLAALVTVVMLIGIVPYLALQLKAVAMSYGLLAQGRDAEAPAWQDSALYVALLMAAFAMLFGTRRASAMAHNRGLVLAMAFESLFKLGAMLALGSLLVGAAPDPAAVARAAAMPHDASGFPALILLGALAMFTLPHQFHAGMVECRDVRHVATARWLFPLYMLLISLPILPLARLGDATLAPLGVPSDLYVLALPLSRDQGGLALFAFLGGLSAATSMVVVATLALSLMVVNHFVAPVRVLGGWGRDERGDLRGQVITQRRIVILGVILLAWAYSRMLAGNDALADIGAISFSALAGLAPTLLIAVYRPRTGARAVGAGLAVGTLVWLYVVLPALVAPAPAWVAEGPFGVAWLAPDRLFGLDDWSRLGRAVVLGIGANLATIALVAPSRYGRVTMPPAELGGVDVGDLRALAARFLPAERVHALFVDAASGGAAGGALAALVEYELAGVIGAGSARLLLQVVHRQRQDELDTVAAIVDEAAEDLRFNQRVLGAALQTMSQGICVVDAELRLVAWNRPYAELFGYPAELLRVGRPAADLVRHNIVAGLIGPGDVTARVERRLALMRSGSPHLAERRFPDGTVVEIRGNPMPGGGYVATFTDVTSFRQAEDELIRANETLELRVAERTAELRQANEAKSHFLTAVSHDLLQPLHAAQLFAHALRSGHADADTARHLDGALTATEDLLAGLLDIARLEGGRLTPRVVDVALADVIGPLAAEGRALAAERGIRFRCVPTHAWVRTDPQLLRRVVQNFLANALRYAEGGRVLLGCRRDGDHVRVEVWDTGPGIADDDRDTIFEAFRRGVSAAGEGLGLGLAIAERTAALMAHPLGLRSWVGRGSVFHVMAPMAPPGPAPNPVALPATVATGHAIVVDNDPAARAATAALLRGFGWTVDALHAPEGAATRPDLLLLDYHLDAGRTGLDALRILRERFGDVATVFVTADRDAGLRARLQEAGGTVLYKPLKPLAMRQAMQRLVPVSA